MKIFVVLFIVLLILLLESCSISPNTNKTGTVQDFLHQSCEKFDTAFNFNVNLLPSNLYNRLSYLYVYEDTIIVGFDIPRTTPQTASNELPSWNLFLIGNPNTKEIYYVFGDTAIRFLPNQERPIFEPEWDCGKQLSSCAEEKEVLKYIDGCKYYKFVHYSDTANQNLFKRIEKEYSVSFWKSPNTLIFRNYTCQELGKSRLLFLRSWKKVRRQCWELVF